MKKVKNYKLKKLTKFLKPCIKMEKTIIKFGDIKITTQIFHQYKRPISIDDMDVSKKVSFDKNRCNYFIGYKDTKRNWTFTHISAKKECIQKKF